MLEFCKYLLIALMSGCTLWLLIYNFRNKKPIKTLFLSSLCGVVSLLIVNIIGVWIGNTLEVNPYTLSVSSLLGIPGVILMVFVKIFWII